MASATGCMLATAEDTYSIPMFTLEDLLRCLSEILGRGTSGTSYALEGYPALAARKIQCDNFTEDIIKDIQCNLLIHTKLSHPNVLRCHQVLCDGELVYVVVDRYRETVESMINRHKRKKQPISEQDIFLILEQIASGLAYLHDSGKVAANGESLPTIIHGGLMPINILASDNDKHFVLTDYGLPRELLQNGVSANAFSYSAPEELIHNRSSPASDIWALGCIIYELATLSRPTFASSDDSQSAFINDWKPNLISVESHLLRELLRYILILDPDARPSAKELVSLARDQTLVQLLASKELRAQVMSLQSEYEVLRQTLDNSNEKHRIELASLKEELDSKSNEISVLKNIIETRSADIGSLRKEVRTRSSRIDGLEAQCKGCISQLQALQKNSQQQQQQFAKATEELRMRVAQGFRLNNLIPMSDSSWTPLMHAVVVGDARAVKKYINDNRNKMNKDGDTALTLAARMGHKDIVELIDPTDKDGVTALMRAADRGDAGVVELLIPLQRGRQAPGKVYINGYTLRNRTALIGAAIYGHTDAAKLLMEHEGGMKDKEDMTALMYAALTNHTELVGLLMNTEGGVQNNEGRTALMYAAQFNSQDSVKLLLKKEACMKDKNGITALMVAANCNSPECVTLLLKKEACMKDNNGWTALMRATCNNSLECVRLLASKEGGIRTTHNVYWEDDDQAYPSESTASDIARRKGYREVLSILSKQSIK
ncbi:Kinase, NEK [Giardia lamblia P15]|uniref:Kinase, NEK n=1 Tax=Giardia intestinalis (strain P15) TaxID=658858 RepID=E1F1K0_GIAIA|nr:Kinase, NEK [Giardia lamblia P15]